MTPQIFEDRLKFALQHHYEQIERRIEKYFWERLSGPWGKADPTMVHFHDGTYDIVEKDGLDVYLKERFQHG